MDSVYIVCAAVLGILAVSMSLLYRKKGAAANVPDTGTECCGKHAVCEKKRLADAAVKAVVYFDDEELDRFAGRSSDSYSDEEIEEFRYVLYTMNQDETMEWLESLHTRSIELPDQLKDETYMMIGE
ncbi:MAG: phospholipase [Bacteroidaceae bacterium]|nr:phospholipase [Bacteroidaceae bacterium]